MSPISYLGGSGSDFSFFYFKQNVMDGHTHRWTDNVKTVYPPPNTVSGV